MKAKIIFIFLIGLMQCILGYRHTHGFSWAPTPLAGRPTRKAPLLFTVLSLHGVFFPSLANVRSLLDFPEGFMILQVTGYLGNLFNGSKKSDLPDESH